MHRLADARGWRSVGEMLDGCSYPEIVTWGAYYSLEGWPDWRADVRSALICSVLANINRDEKKRAEPFTLDDFMLDFTQSIERWKTKEPDQPEDESGAVVSADVVTWLFAKAGAIDVLRADLEAEAETEDE